MASYLTSAYGSFNVPANYRELIGSYERLYDQGRANGQIIPLVYPYHFLSNYALYAYLLIPHKKYGFVYYLRYPLFAWIALLMYHISCTVSSKSMALAMGTGLFCGWNVIWSATLLFFMDVQSLKRVETRPRRREKGKDGSISSSSNQTTRSGSISTGHDASTGVDNELRARNSALTNGHTEKPEVVEKATKDFTVNVNQQEEDDIEYYWQPYPLDSLAHRNRWIGDLYTNFRGMGWSWGNLDVARSS